MRASSRMAEEVADLIRRAGRENVLELASLLLDFRLAIEREAIGEESFGQAMPPNDIGSALTATRRKFDNHRSVAARDAVRFERVMAGIHEGFVIVAFGRMRSRGH